MTIAEFLNASLDDLQALSNMDKTRWSKYLNGQTINEDTLNRAAKNLKMQPEGLLLALNLRRKSKTDAIRMTSVLSRN
jgi:hypothetical protein